MSYQLEQKYIVMRAAMSVERWARRLGFDRDQKLETRLMLAAQWALKWVLTLADSIPRLLSSTELVATTVSYSPRSLKETQSGKRKEPQKEPHYLTVKALLMAGKSRK